MTFDHVSRVRKLYKLILRLHRTLPEDLRILGDNYAREEFKRHRRCKPDEANIFLNEWREYARSMSHQAYPSPAQRRAIAEDPRLVEAVGEDVARRLGRDLAPGRVLHMTPDQLFSLYLMLVSSRGDNPYEPLDAGIELLDADEFARKIEEAKKYITMIDKEEREQLARGEISEEDLTIHTDWWIHFFDQAVKVKDLHEDMAAEMDEALDDDKKDKE